MTGWKGWLRGSRLPEAGENGGRRDDPEPPTKSGNPVFKKTMPTRSARVAVVG